jgi:hypothetical protein
MGFTPVAPAAATIVHSAHGSVVWSAIGASDTTLHRYDFAGGATSTATVSGWVEAADARTAVYREEVDGVTGYFAQDLATSEVHQLDYSPPADPAAETSFDVDDGSLVLAATTTSDAEGLPAEGTLELLPITGDASPLAVPEPVGGLVSAVLRGDQVLYVTAGAAGFTICFRDVATWDEPSCQPFTVPGLADPRTASAALAVGADWVLVTPRWGAGSEVQLVVAGTTTASAPVAVVRPTANRVHVFTVGDSERPLAAVWKGSTGYIGKVAANGTIAQLFAFPTSPAAVTFLRLTPDRLTGLDGRPGTAATDYQAWQRPVSDSAIGAERLLSPRAVAIGASAARTLLDDGVTLRLFDGGVPAWNLTPPAYGVSAESLSGAYYYGRTVAYDQVMRVDGAEERKGQVRALFGSEALMLTNAGLNRYEVVDVTGTASTRVEVPAPYAANFDGLGLWGDYVLGFTTVGNDDTPITVVVNHRTRQSWHHVGYPIELADGFVAIQVPAEAGDKNTDDELAAWNFLTGIVTRMPDRDWGAVTTDGSHRLAYSTGSQLVVRHVAGVARSAPRVLGVLAPPGLNLNVGGSIWSLALDASKSLAPGTLTIENSAGALVRTLAVPATANGSVRGIWWDGTYVSGNPVAAGPYRWTLTQGGDDGSGNLVQSDGSAGISGTIDVTRAPLGTVVGSVPAISDTTPRVGQTLTAIERGWSPTSGLTFSYTWFRSGSTVPVGTGKTYQVTRADYRKQLRVAVTGRVPNWTPTTTVSAYSAKVGKGTFGAPVPTIDNPAPKVGQVLRVLPGTWVPAGTVLKYKWYRVTGSGKAKALKHQTRATLTVTRKLARYRVKVRVTGALSGYTTRSISSARTAKVLKA